MPGITEKISPELWLAIAFHLKPRHVYKLMQTSKAVMRAVDTNEYWARVAVHAVFRNIPQFEISTVWGLCEPPTFYTIASMQSLVNMKYEYRKTIDLVIIKARDIVAEMKKKKKRDGHAADEESLESIVRTGEAMLIRSLSYADPRPEKDMKAVARREATLVKVMTKAQKELRNFQNEVEDDTFFKKLDETKVQKTLTKLLWEVRCEKLTFGELEFNNRKFATSTFSHEF